MSHRPGVAHRKTFPCPYCKKQTQDVNRHMRSCREAKAAVAARAASHRFAFMTLSGFDSDHTLVHSYFFTPRETAATSALTPRSEPVDSAIPAAAPASDLDHMADIPTAGSHSPHQVSLLAVDSGGAMAENESGGTGGGGYSSCGAGLPDSADVGRGPERPVSSAAIMAHLTALSKQMGAIQQAIQQQQQASGYLARPGASNISVGIRKPHTPADSQAAHTCRTPSSGTS